MYIYFGLKFFNIGDLRGDFEEYFFVGVFVLSDSIGSDNLNIDTVLEHVLRLVDALIHIVFISEFDVAVSIGSF
jgi:hypothetical protein